MSKELSRRELLRGMLAATTVIGFDPSLRSWVTAQDLALGRQALADGFPPFEGELRTDDEALTAASDDFGHMVHRRPQAVLLPGSVEDIVKLVQFARQHQIHVAARGQAHSTQGQAQVEAGVVIEMSKLATIHEVNAADVWVDAGVRWIDLLQQTIPQGLTPPVLTDFLDLSVGGTLSVGGVGSQTFRFGAQTDNVLALQVVTGQGQLVTCSPTDKPHLFHAVRAGLGQFALIVRACIRLLPAPPQTRLYQALYTDLAPFLADLAFLVDDGRFDTVQGSAAPNEAGGWHFLLETTKSFAPGGEPDDAALLAGLSFVPGTETSQDMAYFDYLNRLAPVVEFLKQIGVWFFPHPWINLIVPAEHALSLISDVLANLSAADVGEGPVLINPYRRDRFHTPFLRTPGSQHLFLFALLRNAVPPTPERAAELVAANRALFEKVHAVGGKRYPIDSVPMSQDDWRHHFEPVWHLFRTAKQRYDPDGILTPGQAIF